MFLFSSRRRHTRLQGDWSSDVCSSDLTPERWRAVLLTHRFRGFLERGYDWAGASWRAAVLCRLVWHAKIPLSIGFPGSEGGRGEKQRRPRESPHHEKTKEDVVPAPRAV